MSGYYHRVTTDHFSECITFSDFSVTFTVETATLLSMYVLMIISPIQLAVSYISRKNTTCASIGYFARLFVKEKPCQNCISLLNICPRRPAKTDYDVPGSPDFSLTTLQFSDYSRFARCTVTPYHDLSQSLVSAVGHRVVSICDSVIRHSCDRRWRLLWLR